MGKRESLVVLLVAVSSILYSGETDSAIYDCQVTNEGIFISLSSEFNDIYFLELFEENGENRIVIDKEYIKTSKNEKNEKNEINISLKDYTFRTNIRYSLLIGTSRNLIESYIFIGNPMARLENYYTYPLEVIPNIKIIVLKQYISDRRFYYFYDNEVNPNTYQMPN